VEDILDKKTKDKIRKILAKARGTENEAESLAFAAKAAEMLQEHNLAEADLGGEDATEPLVMRTVSSVDWNPWRISIIGALSELYFSRIFLSGEVFKGKYRRCVVVVGRPHNIDVVESMHEYLVNTTLRLAGEYSRDRKERLHFEKGCGMRLYTRIKAMAEAAREPVVVAGLIAAGKNTLPALYKTELELADDMVTAQTGGKLARSSGHRGRSSAIAAGSRAGESINLGGQISSGSKTSHLLGNG
jgi:hypothetical protein